jgi:hypothetical protein
MDLEIKPASAEEPIAFAIPSGTATGFVAHSRTGDKLREKVGELKDDYQDVLSQVAAMVDGSSGKIVGGMHLDQISVALGFDASGKLGFIAGGVEVGVQATVTLTFSKP